MSMNYDVPSVVANRMYAFGEAFAVASAWAIAAFDLSSDDQTALAAMEADITTAGGEALPLRAFPWYRGNTLWADAPSGTQDLQSVNGLDVAGMDGKVVEVSNGAFVLGTGGGGGGYASLGAFDTTPNAKGLSASGTALSLAAADGTNPGGLSAAAQTVGGVKTFSSVPVAAGLTAPATTALTYLSKEADGASAVCHVFDTSTVVSTSGCKWLSFKTGGSEQAFFGVVGGANTLSVPGQVVTGKLTVTSGTPSIIVPTADTTLYMYGNCVDGAAKENAVIDTQAALTTGGAAVLSLKNNGAKVAAVETNGTVFGIYLKSPDGTAYLLTIANGGTVNIAAAP